MISVINAGRHFHIQRLGPGSNFLVNGSWIPSYGPVSNANPNLRWEVKKMNRSMCPYWSNGLVATEFVEGRGILYD